MSKNIYSMLSAFKTNISDDEEEDFDLNKEDFVSEESSEEDLTEISPESLIRILENKEMFMEKKSKVCPEEPKEAFETPQETEKAPEEPKEAFETPQEPEKAPEEPKEAFETPQEPEKAHKEPKKAPEETKPVVIKKEEPKVNHQVLIQSLLRDSETANPLKKLTNAKKSMYSNVIKYESVRTRFF
jgi:hypothetical protein